MARRKSSNNYSKKDYNENGDKSYNYLKYKKYYSAGGSPTEEQREYFEDDNGRKIGYRTAENAAKTQAWKNLTAEYRYSPEGDQSWQVYRAKLMADNPGAEEREQKRIEERNQRIHDANTRMWQNLTKENRYGQNGDQSWQVYRAKLMSENPGSYEKEQERIDRQNRKISEKNTQMWKDLSREYRYGQNGDQSWQVYQAKLMAVNPGAYEREQKRIDEQNRQAKNRYDTYMRQFGDRNELQAEKKYRRWEEENKKAQQAIDIATSGFDYGGWTQGRKDEVKEALDAGNVRESRSVIDKLIRRGVYDEGNDPKLWSQKKRDSQKAQNEETIQQTQENITGLQAQMEENKLPGNRWEKLLDLYDDPDAENERRIINGAGYTEQEKATARDTLQAILMRRRINGNQSVLDSAQSFYRYNIQNVGDEAANKKIENMRQMAYDAVNGAGAYEKLASTLAPEDREALDARIDDALGNFVTGRELRNEQGRLGYTEDQKAQIDYANKVEQEHADLLGKYELGDTQWHPENSVAQLETNPMANGLFKPGTSTADGVYTILGGGIDSENFPVTALGKYANAELMDEKERAVFISLYNDNRKDEAAAFYDGLSKYLNQYYNMYETVNLEDMASRFPVTMSVETVGAHLAQPVENVMNLPGQIYSLVTGKDSYASDPYNERYAATRTKQVIRNKISQNLGDWGWVYNGMMSGVDSALNIAIAKGIGLADQPLKIGDHVVKVMGHELSAGMVGSLGLFATQAFETSLQNNMATGSGNFGYDWMEAFVDAAIETATEIWTVENWLADPTNLLTYVAKIGISEPSEEIVGAIVEPYIKQMIGHKDEYTQRAEEIWNDGYYIDGSGTKIEVANYDEAKRQAMREWNHNIRMAAQEALISVGPAMGRGVISNVVNNRRISGLGQNVGQYREEMDSITAREEQVQQAKNTQGRSIGLQKLMERARQTEMESPAQKMADRIEQKEQQGKKVSSTDVGKLAVELMQDKSVQENPGEIEKIVVRNNRMYNQMQDELKAARQVEDLGEMMATDQERQNAEGKLQKGPGQVILQNEKEGKSQYAKITGVKDGKIVVYVDGQEQKHDVTSLRMLDPSTAFIIRDHVQYPGIYTEAYTNKLLQVQEKGQVKDVPAFLRDAERIRLAAMRNAQLPQTTIPEEMAQEIYAQSQQEIGQQNKASEQQVQTLGPGKGRATFQGAEYGTKAWTRKMNNMKIPKTVQKAAEYVAKVAKISGLDLRLMTEEELKKAYVDLDASKIYGANQSNEIRLNLDGWNYSLGEKTTRHSLVVAMGHEMTHWLKNTSPAAYYQLQDFVMSMTTNDQLMKKIEGYKRLNVDLDMAGVMDEITAEACDQMLGSQQFRQYLEENNQTLFKQVQNFVRSVIERIKNGIGNIQDSASMEARNMMRHYNELAKLWLGAYDQALTREIKQAEAKAAQEAVSSMSMAQMEEQYEQAIKDGDVRLQEQLVKEAAQRAGYTEDVYHGTDTFGFTEFNMKRNSGRVFVAYSEKLARSYTRNGQVQAISERYMGDVETMTPKQLLEQARKMWTQTAWGDKIDSIELLDNGKYRLHYFDTETNKQTKWDVSRIEMEGRIRSMAQEAGQTEGVYHFYGKPGKQLVIDAEGAAANQIYVPEAGRKMNTHQLADWAKKQGYDSVRINNVMNPGVKNESLRGDPELASKDVGIYFNPADLKSADAIVYDDNGKVIPLAERFNDEQTDIRFSMVDVNGDEFIFTQEDADNNGIKVSSMQPVSVVDENRFGKNADEDFRTRASKYFNSIGNAAYNQVFGKVILDRKGVKHLIKSLTYRKAGLLPAVKDVIENGEIIRIDSKGTHHDFDSAIIAAPVRYLGEVYYMGVAIKQENNQNEYYVHDAVLAMKKDGSLPVIQNLFDQVLGSNPSISRILINLPHYNGTSGKTVSFSMAEDLDAQYAEAEKNHDLKTMTRLLTEKMRQSSNRIVPYIAPQWYAGKAAEIAEGIKTGSQEFIDKAAREMSQWVPDNAVLVPMPDHNGQVTDTTDTMILARAISERTGRPVINALQGEQHESRRASKQPGYKGKAVTAETMGFRKIAQIPADAMPIFIDNVVGSGVTAQAAYDAMGGGITLAYAKSVRSKGIQGLKALQPTYYDAQKQQLIPLSQRMNYDVKDFKFSMAQPVEEKGGLIAVHNLTAQNLRDTFTEEGFSAPSIAVIQAKQGHSKFGEISVIFRKSAIDPRRSVKNKIYGTDAWTPTRSNAQIETKLDYETIMAAERKIAEAMKETDDVFSSEASRWMREKAYHDTTTKDMMEWAREAYDNVGMLAAYHAMKGEEVQKEYRQTKNRSDLNEQTIPWLTSFLEYMEENGMLDEFMQSMKGENGEANLKKWGRQFAEANQDNAAAVKTVEGALDKEDDFFRRILLSKLRQAYHYQLDDRQIKTHDEYDQYKTRDTLKANTNQGDFYSWFIDMIGGAFGERGVYNGVDPYTEMGNRRSFRATHWAPTAENIVKAMYRNHEAKGGEAGGATGLMAKASKEYRSIAEVRKDKGRLQQLNEEEYKEKIEDLDAELNDFVDELAETNEYGSYTIKSLLIDAAGQYAKTENAETFRRAMARENIKMTDEQFARGIQLLETAREIPTGYFEAKPERVVGFDEIEKVIIPESETDLIWQMDDMGMPYETYDGTDEDRLKALNRQTSAMFSMATTDNMDVGEWMMNQTPGSLHTEGERQLLQAYRSLRTSMDLVHKRQSEYKAKIKELESKGRLDAEERDQLIMLKNKLQIQDEKEERLEEELFRVTSNEGYANLMYKQRALMNDFIEGKTHAQVMASVDSMRNEAERAAAEIAKNERKLQKMAEDTAVRTIRAELARRGLRMTAETLRSQYNTAMSQGEIEGRLAEIVLKELNGEDATADIEALANDVVTNQVGWANEEADEALAAVRGMTIEIGPGQQQELKATHSSLKEIRQRTKGSGVKFVFGEHSTLDQNKSELEEQIPELRGMLDNEKESLEKFVSYVEGLLKMKTAGNATDFGIDVDEVGLFIRSMANIMLNDEAGGLSKSKLLEKIRKEEGAVGKALEAVQEARKSAEGLQLAGRKAAGTASFMRRDVEAALDYYNQIAKQAAQVEKQKVREGLIETLKSENTRKLLEQRDKYEEKIKTDKKARQIAQDNASLKKVITTDVSRLRKRLTEETDQKNIQEESKPLARFVTRLLVEHDLNGWRKVLNASEKELTEYLKKLNKMEEGGTSFDADADLDWLVIHAPNEEDSDYSAKDRVIQDLIDIESGLLAYRTAEGKGTISLQDRKDALQKVQRALSEIYSVIRARSEAFIEGQKWQVYELAEMMQADMAKSTFKGERTGKLGRTVDTFWKSVGYGNLTPEYFIKNLKNRTMTQLHRGFYEAEQRAGLEARKAKQRIAQIAEESGYATWDGQEKHKIQDARGQEIEITTEQLMALYATWIRENNAFRPEETSHLLHGGFVLAPDMSKGAYGRMKMEQRPIRMSKESLAKIGDQLTDAQKQYVQAIVDYMSGDLATLGNEASLRMFGIKKFTEKYYFPIKSWGGVLNKSSASGVSSNNDNRAQRQSFTKRITANARNTIEIGDFTPTVMKHIVGMINYNTVAPAVENMNKVLNQQLEYGTKTEEADDTYKRNIRAAFQEAYGKNAYDYLTQFMKDVNGGVTTERGVSLREKLLSVFKKNAVAGSMSVAAQQPLSYIRAAMMINPKYLAQALSPAYWKGSFEEMMQHSGVAVIKDMGKFDMNYGRSMIDYITPEAMQTKLKRSTSKISDAATSLPQKTDAMTWTRMWSAVKLEQAALHPEMDTKSEAFLDMVADRFNDLMRRTQVYDSVMVKSQNMRDSNYLKKIATSFMAEPTLSLNVLADAWQNIHEKGGKANAAKALATFFLSAAAQAGAKALFGAGRTPDKKKNQEENFMYKFWYNLLSEANPLGLIPGYRQIIDVLTDGELDDDAMGMLGKAMDVLENVFKLATTGKLTGNTYRDLEDTIGQMVQLGTSVPLKNFMRDFRAMVNWFSGGTMGELTGGGYAQRETSGAVMKYQLIDTIMSEDLIGMINTRLGEAGYKTNVDAYVNRIHEAEKAGNKTAAKEMSEYLKLVKIKAQDPEKTLKQKLNALTKKDDDLSAEDKAAYLTENATAKSAGSFVIEQLKAGKLTPEAAREQLKKIYPDKSDDEIWWQVDRNAYEAETGKQLGAKEVYYRLKDAVNENRTETISKAVKDLVAHGVDRKKIADKMSDWKQEYLSADEKGKIRIRNAVQLVYKELGMTVEEADKRVNSWKPKKEKKD